MAGTGGTGWWKGTGLERWLADLIAAELARMRPGRAFAPPEITPGLALGAGGLELDSLEWLRIVDAIGEGLDLPPDEGPDRLSEAADVGALVAGLRRVLAGTNEAITFRTSGSTGRPRAMTLGAALPMTAAGKPGDWFIEDLGPSGPFQR